MSAASASASSPARPLVNASRPRVDSRMMSVRPSPRAGWFGRVSRAFARVPRPGRLARVPPNVAAFARADDHEASARRDAAATTGRLAPLDVTTMVGAELELIMKVDPNAFERTLADKVRRASSNPHRSRHRPCTPATAARGNILYPPTFRRRRRTTVNHPRLPARFSPAATRPRPSLPRHSPPPLPLAPDPPSASQLRDLSAEVLHPTFPGGRSGTLRPNAPEHRAGRDGHHDRDDRHHDDDDDAKRAENEMGEGRVRREDRREDEALRRHVPLNPAYLAAEGIRRDQTPTDAAADEAMARELTAAIASVAAAARRRETRDALYVAAVHRFNACGVPLAADVDAFQPAGRHPAAGRDAGRRGGRHAEKIRRMIRELLPPGAEDLIDVGGAESSGGFDDGFRFDDDLRFDVRPGLDATFGFEFEHGGHSSTPAGTYVRAARFGYFLARASSRVSLERRFQSTGAARGPACDLDDANTNRDARGNDPYATNDATDDATDDATHLARDATSLPAYPVAIGDWIAEEEYSDAVRDAEKDAERAETETAPRLRAFVDAMDPALRASLARVSGEETSSILREHVRALFGKAGDEAVAEAEAEAEAEAGAEAAAAAAAAAAANGTKWTNRWNVSRRDASSARSDAGRMSRDALWYLVVEAMAFGAQLHAVEKLGEAYGLVRSAPTDESRPDSSGVEGR